MFQAFLPLILLSSRIINEESLIKPKKYFSEYAESKAKAEELVLEYSKSVFSYIILYPTRVFGIGPLTDANGATNAISLYAKNKFPFVIDGGKQFSSWAFAEDVAMGIVNAVNNSVFNEKYILGEKIKLFLMFTILQTEFPGKNILE